MMTSLKSRAPRPLESVFGSGSGKTRPKFGKVAAVWKSAEERSCDGLLAVVSGSKNERVGMQIPSVVLTAK